MPRSTYPTQLRDHLGNEVRLPPKPFATGGEGAVFDVVGRPDIVAKLYSKPQSKERCDKLRAMADLCTTDLLKFAAWPTATLSNNTSAIVEGILMPRIANHKEIHHLYSVAQRKKDFPDADWGFLLHTARNCAIAFESVHDHGHIVGDVNQKNVMVSQKGTVALVDCDSFQVKEGNRIYRCGVGVPEYTPPELHGRKFTDLDRDASHDLFGLAVMIFHLLMMGRHPFAGVPQDSSDIPIEKAIKDGFYAYSRNPTKLRPPPHVPPLTMLDVHTCDLFERAFRSRQRPTAREWRNVLDASIKGLQRCKNDPKHSYPASGNCPWCQLIAAGRVMFFIPSQGATGATPQIEGIRGLIQNFTAKKLLFTVYVRPNPVLPVAITLPTGLRAVQKPALLPHPATPAPIQRPSSIPTPHPPVFLATPKLRQMPTSPTMPLAPRLISLPPAPVGSPVPKLHSMPPLPICPPAPTLGPPDRFVEMLCIFGAAAGVPVYFIAWPVGLIMMVGLGLYWFLMKVTEGMRRRISQKSLNDAHEVECANILDEYEDRIRPIRKANEKILRAWQSENSAAAARHEEICKAIDQKNNKRMAPWEAEKAAIEAKHLLVVKELQQENTRIISAWQAENDARQSSYDRARQEIEQENQRRVKTWTTLSALREEEHRQKCQEIDAKNRQIVSAWEKANAPWIIEQKRWSDLASAAETEIKRIENDLMALRQLSSSKFMQRKADAEGVIQSLDGVRQDYERELRQAEIDSWKIQLDEHLDKSLIRNARLMGITGERLLSLESFGIQTGKDVPLLNLQKVPGIGPVLSQRLFDWRNKLVSSFQPKQGLPESEKRRLVSRYAPVVLPLTQAIQVAIKDLDDIASSHRNLEAKHVENIAAAVQNRAVAEAYVRAMKVL